MKQIADPNQAQSHDHIQVGNLNRKDKGKVPKKNTMLIPGGNRASKLELQQGIMEVPSSEKSDQAKYIMDSQKGDLSNNLLGAIRKK